jgi:UDP-glucose:(heptosyl)LPS alpha-1,3-glucosyltransferase
VQSFERTVGQDIYRAGDGCHREWLAQRSLVETPWKNFCIALNPLHLYYLSIERRIFASTPLIVAPAERTKREIMDHYRVAPERIRVVRTGVDRERFHPGLRDLHRDRVRRELGVPAEAPVAVFVGSGFHRKGLAWAIRALARLGSQGAYLLVAGRGEKGPYGRLAVEEGLGERVRLLGPRADVEALYGASDVFLLPTLYDPCSNATLEALASGLAVVTTEANGASEAVVPGRSGIVLRDPFDLEALARAVREALDLDRGELVRCSQEALGPYCWDKHREAMMACYEEVLRLKAAA